MNNTYLHDYANGVYLALRNDIVRFIFQIGISLEGRVRRGSEEKTFEKNCHIGANRNYVIIL